MRTAERFTDFIQAHVEKTDKYRVFIDKEETRRIAKSAKAPLPEVYQLVPHITDVEFSTLPDAFVIKPTHFASKKGVYILFRVRNKFFDLFSKRVLSDKDIVMELTAIAGRQKSNIIVEEFITGQNGSVEIPYDYKIYTFDAGVGVIVQINRNTMPNEICIFDGDFIPLGSNMVLLNDEFSRAGAPDIPRNAKQVIDMAKDLQREMDRPFISVDCFTTGERVILGELTPSPGGPYFGGIFRFSPALDKALGQFQIDGYLRRGWQLPTVEGYPPSRKTDSLFSNLSAKRQRSDVS